MHVTTPRDAASSSSSGPASSVFTLYRDGVAIFRDPAATVDGTAGARPAWVGVLPPFRIAKLPEEAQ